MPEAWAGEGESDRTPRKLGCGRRRGCRSVARVLSGEQLREFGDNGYLTGWIAVRYEPGGLTESQRYDFEFSISCINTWVGEEGQDC